MKEIETEIRINASPAKVWQVFMANHDWSAWNPFIVKSEGRMDVGQRVTNTMVMTGRKPMTFRPTILKADPEKELRWLGRLLIPGIFDGEHYFQLEASGGGTRFVQGEKFSGLLSGMLNLDEVRASFSALNEALKKRVES
ncbi:MAG: SRPBCC family protein [Myxococcaceae bacterium]